MNETDKISITDFDTPGTAMQQLYGEASVVRAKEKELINQSLERAKQQVSEKTAAQYDKYLKRISVFSPNFETMGVGQVSVKLQLYSLIDKLIEDGANTLITRLDYGADTAAAEKFMELKSSGANVNVLCMMPYRGWRSSEYPGYKKFVNEYMPKLVGATVTIGAEPSEDLVQIRDQKALCQSFYHIFVMPPDEATDESSEYIRSLLDYSFESKDVKIPTRTLYVYPDTGN